MEFTKCLLVEDFGPLCNIVTKVIHLTLGNDVKVLNSRTMADARIKLTENPDIDIILVDSYLEFSTTHHLVWDIRGVFKGVIIGITNTSTYEGEQKEMMDAGCLHVCVKVGGELRKYLEHLAKEV